MFNSINQLWGTWDLRLVILFSLFLQTFLLLSAPLRKKTVNALVTVPIWLAYTLADVTATFGVGLISKSQSGSDSKSQSGDAPSTGPFAHPELVAFWAPFLLLHLGGPDTITAFALEDNELWLRHLLHLVFQLATAAYVFILTLSSNNRLWLPTLLIFISALIKSTERTRSLYLASWHRFRDSLLKEPDPGPNYHKLMDEYYSNKDSGLPTRLEFVEGPNPKPSVGENCWQGYTPGINPALEYGYIFFQTFKGLMADLIFSFRERDNSRSFLLNRNSKEAFEMMEVELNSFYDILFTKAMVMRGKYGFPLRFVSFVSCFAALLLYHLMDAKQKYLHQKIDVAITYALLLGAIAHDVIALIVFISSDLTIGSLVQSNYLLSSRRHNFCRCYNTLVGAFCCCGGWFTQIMLRRWSERISQYNLIFCCLHHRSNKWDKLIRTLGLSSILDGRKYVKKEQFDHVLRDFIFEELKNKSLKADDIETAKEICSAKGDWVLRVEDGCDYLLKHYTLQLDYDEILILWHIATELCYNTDKGNSENMNFRKISKILSDYMLYLLLMEPSMMSAVAGIGQTRFRDTCAEAKMFFQDRGILEKKQYSSQLRDKSNRQSNLSDSEFELEMIQVACKSILDVNTEVKPVVVKGDKSKTVLFDACILAKELMKLDKNKWKIMSKVWVELLSYAACRCTANIHAKQLSKGGNLISLIWLLMVHLGLGYQFQVSKGHQRVKIILQK